MKSHFSRFLHNFLSHSDVNPQPTPMLSYSGLTRISRWNKFATLFNLDHRVKPDGDREGADASLKPEYDNIVENALSKPDGNTFVAGASTCRGRSMVEMLGVLAIIGVLSVGAIAGYSKAMMKYKMNQAADGYNHLIATVIEKIAQDNSVFAGDSVGTLWYTSIFAKAGWLPDYFRPRNDTETNPAAINYVQDKLGNNVWIFKNKKKELGIGVEIRRQKELCMTLFNLAKEWKGDLARCDSENANGSAIYGQFFGDKSCSDNVKCLANVTVNDINAACSPCDTQYCRFYFMTNAMR